MLKEYRDSQMTLVLGLDCAHKEDFLWKKGEHVYTLTHIAHPLAMFKLSEF